ncbi:neocarzinostatin apoprotein domain-containing protein [Streptomyces lavendulae]|uniref:neocarzinostatin apoprotein domain-containing protein n=1 Tax=Streptomyces lavendulae TaxID=1914 RepID=UPI0036939C1A
MAHPCRLVLTDNFGTVLATVALRFGPDSALETAPTVRVDPSEGLVDGESVRVTGWGYEPRYHSVVLECAADSTEATGCRSRVRPPATTDQGRWTRRSVSRRPSRPTTDARSTAASRRAVRSSCSGPGSEARARCPVLCASRPGRPRPIREGNYRCTLPVPRHIQELRTGRNRFSGGHLDRRRRLLSGTGPALRQGKPSE